MWDDGYRNIVNIDVGSWDLTREKAFNLTQSMLQYSGVLIQQMQQRHGRSRPEMECMPPDDFVRWIERWPIIYTGHEMDVRSLAFEDASFDVAIDKGMPL